MKNQMTFRRYELKYMITKEQKERLQKEMEAYMDPDPHGRSTIQSLYFDTPNFQLVRQSIEKPFYKEKLRLRSYGVANEDTKVFLELKKKYESVVYKRRESMSVEVLRKYLDTRLLPKDTQIFKEIDYAFKQYEGLYPAVLLSYDRAAYYAKDDHEFRITFDENILWRDYDVDLTKGIYGNRVVDENQVMMEVKVASGIPLWLVKILSEEQIYKTSFSKYGTAYKQMMSIGGK